jgi:hypothetical protein
MSTNKTISINLEISDANKLVSQNDLNLYLDQAVQNIERVIGDGLLSSGDVEVELDSWDINVSDSEPTLIFDVTEEHFKASAKRLKTTLVDVASTTIGHAKSLQILSKSLYNKPFEEIKETVLKKDNKVNNQEVASVSKTENRNHVILIDIGNEHALFVNGEFETATYRGCKNEISTNRIFDIANNVANNLSTNLEEAFLNIDDYFDGEFEFDDLKVIFNIEGLITSNDFELINKLDNLNISIINGDICRYAANGEWRSEFFSENETINLEHVVWMPENDNKSRFYGFSLNDLMNAQKINVNTWSISLDGQKLIIEVLK